MNLNTYLLFENLHFYYANYLNIVHNLHLEINIHLVYIFVSNDLSYSHLGIHVLVLNHNHHIYCHSWLISHIHNFHHYYLTSNLITLIFPLFFTLQESPFSFFQFLCHSLFFQGPRFLLSPGFPPSTASVRYKRTHTVAMGFPLFPPL